MSLLFFRLRPGKAFSSIRLACCPSVFISRLIALTCAPCKNIRSAIACIAAALIGTTVCSLPAIAGITFCADCSQPFTTGSWEEWQEWEAGRLNREGSTIIGHDRTTRVQVDPGDNVGFWGGERAEFAAMLDGSGKRLPVNETTAPEYYAISIRLPVDWHSPQPDKEGKAWGTFFQLHGPDALGAPPSLALMVQDRFHINFFSGNVSAQNKAVQSFDFSNGSLRLGSWVQFIVEVRWSATETGSVIVYRRDRCDLPWTAVFERRRIATLQYEGGKPVGDHYWKAGYYRSASDQKDVLWLGPIARGVNWKEVEYAAFNVRCKEAGVSNQ